MTLRRLRGQEAAGDPSLGQGLRQAEGVAADPLGRRGEARHDLEDAHHPATSRAAASASSGVARESRAPGSRPRLRQVSGYPHCA